MNWAMDIGDLIAANLKRILKEKGVAVTVVAKEAGLGRMAVKDIIDRKSKNPAYANLVKIAQALDVPVHEITGGTEASIITDEDRRILYAMSRLSPETREVLLKSAEAQISDDD